MDLDGFLRLKEELENLQRDHQRAQGRLESTLLRLSKKHGCGSLSDAKKVLSGKEDIKRKLEARYERLLVKYQGTYQEKLGL